MKKQRAGITMWEVMLFTVFLGIAGGASVFFFFINSGDVKKAQQKYLWVQQVNQTLDSISLEIANAAQIEHPFAGSSRECFFRPVNHITRLEPDVLQEGFSFSDGTLLYVSRSADTVSRRSDFGVLNNPLVSNVRDCSFERISADRIAMKLTVASPDGSAPVRNFYRLIYLRNQ